MPQMSVHYAAGRIYMLRRDALDVSRVERLLSASSLAEARGALSDMGWAGAETEAWESLAEKRVLQAVETVRALTTDQRVTDCFLLKYDVSNLKMLLKARTRGTAVRRLSPCGALDADVLRHAVAAHQYGALPAELSRAMDSIENQLLTETNPLAMDLALDHAMFRQIAAWLKDTKCAEAKRYFANRADWLNMVTALRLRHMGRDASSMRDIALPGGRIPAEALAEAVDQPEKLPGLLPADADTKLRSALTAAVQSFSAVPHLERAIDDALLDGMRGGRYEYMNLPYIISYLLGTEREAAAVRLILSGKANGFAQDAVRERLRDLYA